MSQLDSKHLQKIIDEGESETVEFKSSFNDAAIETITAFSNNKGGRIFIGLNNTGEPVKGFSVGTETIQKWQNEIKIKTQPSIIPDINFVNYKTLEIVEIKVQEFPIKPVAFKGRYFK
jgi:ATP-dependent DNA helicase RecG